MFQTGTNKWVAHDAWPPKNATPKKLYFHPAGKLALDSARMETDRPYDTYVSDPANPVPYRPRPVTPTYPGREWQEWMVEDQRFAHQSAGRADLRNRAADRGRGRGRLDAGPPLRQHHRDRLRLDRPADRRLSGGLPRRSGDGRLPAADQRRAGAGPLPQEPGKAVEPVVPDKVEEYAIDLHWGHHCFRKGHKIMVQVQSTWFPLIDRNPQNYVPNIFEARDEDFRPAQQRVFRSAKHPSHVVLETLPAGSPYN